MKVLFPKIKRKKRKKIKRNIKIIKIQKKDNTISKKKMEIAQMIPLKNMKIK